MSVDWRWYLPKFRHRFFTPQENNNQWWVYTYSVTIGRYTAHIEFIKDTY